MAGEGSSRRQRGSRLADPGRLGAVVGLVGILALAGCGGEGGGPAAPGSGSALPRLEFVDGPADHEAGGAIPTFRVWVLDDHGVRDTRVSGGTVTLDLLDTTGAVQSAGFASIPVSFGQATVATSISLPLGTGYSVRATYAGRTADSPPFSVVSAPDVVRMTNASAGEAGLLVDGANNIGPLQDRAYTTSSTELTVGVLNSGTLTQAVTVFAADRRPELVPVSWTGEVDTLIIGLGDPVALPITVWVIGGSFAAEKAKVELGLAGLGEVWRQERVGIEIGDLEFMDATSLSDGFGIFALGIGAPFGPIANGVGRAGGRFNIYVVEDVRVDGESVDGFAELPGTAIAVTSDALVSRAVRALGHEFGHNFGLRDTQTTTEGFQVGSNMMADGLGATVMTEGQTFRAHFDRSSPLRSLRTGDTFPSLTCDLVDATTHCPALALRIWQESEPAAALRPLP